ncbi:VacJ family lipoprotein [Aliiglaciecola sp. LCG003]|uniref:MlaA family lipoprotein n=1 Tax=Aliiglaciecola sp. LCG003 TaxID=3053655 RepID=UPI002573D622|nr:VacJ family lipoprotein [Aliiglaciecola sp. LCG003]WJG08582.1 VacJ family lipoprotein [Aliiglaciecola sp. LCG003]
MTNKILLVIATLLALGGCASRQASDEQVENQGYADPRDPIEGFNRVMWDFNYDVLDAYILRPTTVVYVDYMPHVARTGLYNAALNLEEPSNTLNNLLQGKVGGSLTSLGRFVLNSTVGILGLIDVAKEIGLERQEEEFGEVLGKYGIGTGAFLMIPAMGPSDIRSSVGDFVDSSYFPLQDLSFYVAAVRTGIKALEARAQLIEQEGNLEQSLDPYAFVKNAYFQNLEFKVTDGKVPPSELQVDPEVEEEGFEDFLDDL